MSNQVGTHTLMRSAWDPLRERSVNAMMVDQGDAWAEEWREEKLLLPLFFVFREEAVTILGVLL